MHAFAPQKIAHVIVYYYICHNNLFIIPIINKSQQ